MPCRSRSIVRWPARNRVGASPSILAVCRRGCWLSLALQPATGLDQRALLIRAERRNRQIELLKRLDNYVGHQRLCKPFVIGGHDVPRGMAPAGGRKSFLVCRTIRVPLPAFPQIGL